MKYQRKNGSLLIHHLPEQLLLLTLRILVVLVTFTHSQISLGTEVPLSILAYSLLCIFSYISDLSDSYLVIFNIIFFQFLQFILWIYILVFVWLIVLKGQELIGTSGRRSIKLLIFSFLRYFSKKERKEKNFLRYPAIERPLSLSPEKWKQLESLVLLSPNSITSTFESLSSLDILDLRDCNHQLISGNQHSTSPNL